VARARVVGLQRPAGRAVSAPCRGPARATLGPADPPGQIGAPRLSSPGAGAALVGPSAVIAVALGSPVATRWRRCAHSDAAPRVRSGRRRRRRGQQVLERGGPVRTAPLPRAPRAPCDAPARRALRVGRHHSACRRDGTDLLGAVHRRRGWPVVAMSRREADDTSSPPSVSPVNSRRSTRAASTGVRCVARRVACQQASSPTRSGSLRARRHGRPRPA